MNLNQYKNIWFTADLHLNHVGILKHCADTRNFSNINQMNNEIITHWNETVGLTDIVFILGDVGFGRPEDLAKILKMLNGTKVLIIGNHDKKLLLNKEFKSCFIETHYYLELSHDDRQIILFHYPILEWNNVFRDSFHLFGHVHGQLRHLQGKCMDVGFDIENRLFSFEDIKEKLDKKPIKVYYDDFTYNPKPKKGS